MLGLAQDGNGRGAVPMPNNNETIDLWMRQKLNVTLASRDFRLPISPEYARGDKSGYEYIRDHLGYRLELRSATLPAELVGGNDASFSFDAALVNWGFAAPISPRPVQLVVLSDNGTVTWRSATLADPRDWQPYQPGDPTFLPLLHRLHGEVSIPAAALSCGMPSCTFKFGLYLPDMRMDRALKEGPAGGAAYCIRLANGDMPWIRGVNVLSDIRVDWHH